MALLLGRPVQRIHSVGLYGDPRSTTRRFGIRPRWASGMAPLGSRKRATIRSIRAVDVHPVGARIARIWRGRSRSWGFVVVRIAGMTSVFVSRCTAGPAAGPERAR